MREKLQKIKEFYDRAWKAIKSNNIKEATNILYKEMSIDLFDMSLNILYSNFKEEELLTQEDVIKRQLQSLIKRVDNKLTEKSIEEDPELIDDFKKQF